MKKRIGAFIGKFYPPHVGHLSVIDNAIKSFDEVYVIISKNKLRNESIKESDNFDEIDANLIKEWFEEHYKNQEKIKIKIFDETGLKPYPDDMEKWAKKFKKEFPSVNAKIADAEYREFNKKFFPEYEFYEIDRESIPIHSSMLRKDIKGNLKYLIPEAKDYFIKKEKQK